MCEALQSLKAKDRKLIELVFGICPSCLMDKERKTLREASLLLGLTESGAEQKLKRILKSITNSYIYISNRYFTFVEFHFII